MSEDRMTNETHEHHEGCGCQPMDLVQCPGCEKVFGIHQAASVYRCPECGTAFKVE